MRNGDLGNTSFANSPILISSKFSDIFAECMQNPQTFFSEIGRDLTRATDDMPDVFFEIHDEDKNTGIRAELCVLYRRFKLRNFYLLAVRLDYHTGERWCRNASSQLANEIRKKYPSRSLGDDDLKQCLDDYVRIGQKYNRWAEELGGPGYLLALPLEITEREYTDRHYSRYIPAAIERFRVNGIDQIVKTQGLDVLGKHIAHKLAQSGSSHESLKRPLTKSAMRSRKKRKQESGGQSSIINDMRTSSKAPRSDLGVATMTEDHSERLLPFPEIQNALNATPQIDPLSAGFLPTEFQNALEAIAQIDPTSADFPSADFQNSFDAIAQIDPTSADFPSVGLENGFDATSQTDHISANFQTALNVTSQIDLVSASFPYPDYSRTFDSRPNLDFGGITDWGNEERRWHHDHSKVASISI
ncbi:hypothetical protein PDIDSM_5851 [Penicillium digitatum]|nr:hypothetical protein PDIDSM_5851 [Penicillium digitatum]